MVGFAEDLLETCHKARGSLALMGHLRVDREGRVLHDIAVAGNDSLGIGINGAVVAIMDFVGVVDFVVVNAARRNR